MGINWTPDQDKILIDLYETGSREEILTALAGKSWRQCYRRSIILGLSRPKDDAWKKEELNLLKELYPNTPKDILITKFPGRTWKGLSWQAINTLRLVRTKEVVQAETKKTNRTKLGVDYPTQSQQVRDKVKETVQERYGVDNVFQSEDIKQKISETNIEKFGVENPNQCKEIRDKTKQTNLNKYGIGNTFQLTDRVQAGMVEKYGHKSPLQVPEIQAHQQNTNVERYGFKTPAQNEEIQRKIENTNLNRYGVKTPFKALNVKIKIRKTVQSKYGVNNPAQSNLIKRKIQKTCFEKYGIKSFLCLEEIRRKGRELSILNNSINKSKGENSFKTYLKMLDPNTKQHKEHPVLKQVIDFYMPKYDLWVQYDGIYWHGKTIRINKDTKQYKKILKTIERDKKQNEFIPNLIRFWSDDVDQALKSNTIFDLIISKIDEKSIGKICHQFKKKLEHYTEDIKNLPFNIDVLKISDFILQEEKLSNEIKIFIKKYEWLGTIGFNVKWCFTARYQNILAGVILISEPASYSQILGQKTSIYEAIIQRGASISWAPRNLGSKLLMFACHWMVNNTTKRAFIGYADPQANERGIIYRACNFQFLGNSFGDNFLYKHPQIPKHFSSRYLRRTSTFKAWCKANKIHPQETWFKENDFKNLKIIPEDIKEKWYHWGRQILKESEKIKLQKKSKYVLILPKDKREKKFLDALRNFTPLLYPD